MPPMHFTSVDLPAPLSPTSEVTSPALAAKSTSFRTCTGPKLLFTPRSSRTGVPAGGGFSVMSLLAWAWAWPVVGPRQRQVKHPRRIVGVMRTTGKREAVRGWARATTHGRSRHNHIWLSFTVRLDTGLRAQLGELAGAELGLGVVAVVDDRLHVGLGDGDRLQQHRRHVPVARRVVARLRRVALLTLRQADRESRPGVGLLLDGLVHGHALVAVEDVLQTGDGGVLAGDRHLPVEPVLRQNRERRATETVIRRQHTANLRLLGQHLLEDRPGLLVVPLGNRLFRALDE